MPEIFSSGALWLVLLCAAIVEAAWMALGEAVHVVNIIPETTPHLAT